MPGFRTHNTEYVKYNQLNPKETRVSSKETQEIYTYNVDLGVLELPLTASPPVSFMPRRNTGLLLTKAVMKRAET